MKKIFLLLALSAIILSANSQTFNNGLTNTGGTGTAAVVRLGGTVTSTSPIIDSLRNNAGTVEGRKNGVFVNQFTLPLTTIKDTQYLRRDKNAKATAIATKHATLVSGTNIKTDNGNSLLGSGDVAITTATPSLNQVTAVGNSSDNSILVGDDLYKTSILKNGINFQGGDEFEIELMGRTPSNHLLRAVDAEINNTIFFPASNGSYTMPISVNGVIANTFGNIDLPSTPSYTLTKNATQDSIILSNGNLRYAVIDSTGITSVPTLQQVTTAGNTSTNPIIIKENNPLSGFYTRIDVSKITFGNDGRSFSENVLQSYAGTSVYRFPENVGGDFTLPVRVNNQIADEFGNITLPVTAAIDTQYLRRDINANTVAIATKQATLVSGTNIKTVNGNSLLGSGNIAIASTPTPSLNQVTSVGNISYNPILVGDDQYYRTTVTDNGIQFKGGDPFELEIMGATPSNHLLTAAGYGTNNTITFPMTSGYFYMPISVNGVVANLGGDIELPVGTAYTGSAPIVVTGSVISADTAKAQGKLATFNDVLISSKWATTGNDIYSLNSGNVGIGTNTIPSNYKLAVAGAIIATKVKVQLQANWPDYVFNKNYELPSLQSIESFIKINKHLPDVPSADEVKKEGINLGDNQAILLKKVEELTLYMIELNKKVEVLGKENEALKKKVNGIKQ